MSETSVHRNAERTRRAVLDAALAVLLRKSAAMTIADVAEHAGVSKSGLLHHFKSRSDLLRAVLVDVHTRMRTEVRSHLDLSENVPGKMLRAYVRTVCGQESEIPSLLNSLPFWTGLEGVPGANELESAEQVWWREQFLADGLDPMLVLLVRRAAEGVSMACSFGDESQGDLVRAGEALITMTLDEGATMVRHFPKREDEQHTEGLPRPTGED